MRSAKQRSWTGRVIRCCQRAWRSQPHQARYSRRARWPQSATDSSDTAVGEIIVSARRRNESVQDAPLAITALSPAQMESTGSRSISDLQGAAPNVLITKQVSGASAANISIRGIAFADIEKSFDPSVGVLIDGVYIGTSTGQLLDFFDLESIEILRGPQGTLFGRNTIGGVINLQRSRPTGKFGGKFELGYGSSARSPGAAYSTRHLSKTSSPRNSSTSGTRPTGITTTRSPARMTAAASSRTSAPPCCSRRPMGSMRS